MSKKYLSVVTSLFGLVALVSADAALADGKATIGFVTHAQGDPFIQQIVDGAQAAADNLGVTLRVAQTPGLDPEAQLSAVQNFINSGVVGVATTVPGQAMVRSLNDIVASGTPVVQYNLLSTSVKAPYVGEKSVESGRILGRMIVAKLGGPSVKGTVVIGNCFPGFLALENRAKGVEESLKIAPGLKVLGPFDVKVSAVDNYNHWEQLYAANPSAIAMIGLCAPDVASLGKLNAANGDKFIAGGYDMTEENLAAIKGGHAYVTLGQSAFVQGYMSVALLVHAIKTKTPLPVGFFNSGTQIVTRDGVDMGNGLPKITYDQAQALASNPKATAAYYEPWTQSTVGDGLMAGMKPISAESR